MGQYRYISAPRVLAGGMALVMLVSAGLLLITFNDREQAGRDYTFITADHPPNYPFIYPVRAGKVDMPGNVQLETVSSPSSISEQLLAGNAEMGYVSFVALSKLSQRYPDTRIIPYKGNAPHQKSGVYGREGTGISSIEDLEGSTVGIPMRSSSGILTLLALQEEGIDYRRDMEVVPTKGSAATLLESGEVDAGLYFGIPSREQMEDLNPVFYPTRYMESNFGSDVLALGVSTVDNREAIQAGNRTFKAFREAGRYSIENTGAVSAQLEQKTGQNFSRTLEMATDVNRSESLHVPMEPVDFRVLQRALDFAYRERLVPHRTNVSELYPGYTGRVRNDTTQ